MQSPLANEFVLTDYVRSLVRFKTKQLTDRWDFQNAEPEDLQQDLWLALLRAACHFDPAKASLDTFLDRVVNSSVAMMLRARKRFKHGHAVCTQSLDRERAPQSDLPESLSAVVDPDDLARRTGATLRDETALREHAEAIDYALMRMPNEVRRVCECLMNNSIAAAARQLGVTRRQVRRLAAAAQPYLEQAGLGFPGVADNGLSNGIRN